jgi:hypothetical protein
MMRIGIEINGVLRDTIEKFKQLYEHHMIGKMEFDSIDKTYEITFSGDTEEIVELNENVDVKWFEYKILSEVNSLELDKHFAFPSKDELYTFMYEDYTMELFGHSPSTEINTFNILNDLYIELRDNYKLLIVSDEIGKSKPASLFFLAKFGCLLEQVFFYSEITKNDMWDNVDILLTANPILITNKPDNKIVVKFKTKYNENVKSDYEISTLSEFNLLLNKIKESYV